MAKSNSASVSSSVGARRNSKGKVKWVRYLILLLPCLGIYPILTGPSGAFHLFKLKQANANQMHELDSLTLRRTALTIEKIRLQKDSTYIERVARKELGMAKPGEKVFRYMAPEVMSENQDKKK